MTQRRSLGGPRHEASERVVLKGPGRDLDGWTLNVSRGGLRVVLEDKVRVGDEFEVRVGSDDEGSRRPGRVVWVQDAADGQIVGLKYLDNAEVPPGPSSPPAGGT